MLGCASPLAQCNLEVREEQQDDSNTVGHPMSNNTRPKLPTRREVYHAQDQAVDAGVLDTRSFQAELLTSRQETECFAKTLRSSLFSLGRLDPAYVHTPI